MVAAVKQIVPRLVWRLAMVLAIVALAADGPAAAAAKRVLLADIGATSLSASRNAEARSGLAEARHLAVRNGRTGIIVGLRVPFAPEGDLSETDRRAQRSEIVTAGDVLKTRLMQRGRAAGLPLRTYSLAPFLALQATPAEIDFLSQQPEVLTITPDLLDMPQLAESTQIVGASTAWASGYTGAGKVVAVIDSGVDKAHPFLAGKVVSEACYSGGGDPAKSTCPEKALSSTTVDSGVPCNFTRCDHGTHVAGIISGNAESMSGVAKGAQLIAINAMNTDGLFSRSDLMAALQRVYDLKDIYPIVAVNMSLGIGSNTTYCDTDTRKPFIDSLRSVNIATVASSGNDGYTSGIHSPACISSVVSVGSTWDSSAKDRCGPAVVDSVACSSNSSSFLKLLAPGARITSSVPGGAFMGKTGTSMAAPHVAGAWAVIRQKYPSASVSEVLDALTATGKPVLDAKSGHVTPRIDLAALMRSADISLSASSYTTSEATPWLTIPVTRTRTSDSAIVGFTLSNGSAVNGRDYGGATSGTVTFAAGAATATLSIPIIDNAVFGPDKTFSVTLNTAPPGHILAPPTTANVTILNDDRFISIAAARYKVAENRKIVRIDLTRKPASGTASIGFTTVNGTAVAGRDYKARSGRIKFASGARRAFVDIAIYNDSRREASEYFFLKLAGPSSGYRLGTVSKSRITILNDD